MKPCSPSTTRGRGLADGLAVPLDGWHPHPRSRYRDVPDRQSRLRAPQHRAERGPVRQTAHAHRRRRARPLRDRPLLRADDLRCRRRHRSGTRAGRKVLRRSLLWILPLLLPAMIAIALVIPLAAPTVVPTLSARLGASPSTDINVEWRTRALDSALDGLSQHPLTGFGFGHPVRFTFLGQLVDLTGDPHNSYVYILAGGGFLALGSLLAIMLAYLVDVARRMRERPGTSGPCSSGRWPPGSGS